MKSFSIKIVPQVPCSFDSVVTYSIVYVYKNHSFPTTLETVPKTKRPWQPMAVAQVQRLKAMAFIIAIKHYFMHPQNEIFSDDFSKKRCD